jgi:TetR/AcrR family transcriptional regulator, ethionamide resistance regulator
MRHRRRRLSTRGRILDAALALLEARPWHEISLEEIMRSAGLTRTAFYRHFDDREALLVALLEHIGVRLEQVPDAWRRAGGDPVTELRAAVSELVDVYGKHGRLLGALAEAANHNAQVRVLYLGLADRLISAVAERIATDVAAGRSRISDPEEVARALIWMNERYLDMQFGRDVRGDPERASRALSEVWIGALYRAGGVPDDSPSGAG